MEAVKGTLFSIINYFHKDDRYNRVTLGLDRNPSMKTLIRWRFADVFILGSMSVLFMFTYYIPPFQRQFFVDDLTISHPFAENERVSNSGLFFYAVWIPLTVIIIIGLIFTKPANKVYVTYISVMGLLIAVFTASITTDILKNFIGRHRPDFLARCIPRADTPTGVMVFAKDVCTTDNTDRLMDGFRTTPSGHSSISFSGLGYLSFWLAGQLIVKHYQSGAWRSIVAFAPSFGASLIALSRTEDYRHHFIDVIIGSILGLGIGYWSYFRYFPSLTSTKAFEPLIISNEHSGSKIHDEDESVEYHTLDTTQEDV
ncbi:Diacylglycerol pyrophosphate phosphatase 1 [Yamadazyma tenuis]|uniref:PAP2-domain-containing protein n=1 Tax=Candida tenuis (strain ATCC 10573 / BCRC 21748 / CBS 615 / JCM 9827 / NBRC 10315 / NRRL Y-1498 / VKM Y-70) TaxID=590646 RepID=G3BBI7_CANTC|nr:PAP2-domain-containing protein [Yamadazyma tenuis ATCC 10573]EGV61548.1 PAP2-domain-containing protein [Yamadazyma tenuis ATCC 10573]WEJ92770.1 Diacylglycerol pyrophosphate phosphatase 1 [Yamadazyma tenuis]